MGPLLGNLWGHVRQQVSRAAPAAAHLPGLAPLGVKIRGQSLLLLGPPRVQEARGGRMWDADGCLTTESRTYRRQVCR